MTDRAFVEIIYNRYDDLSGGRVIHGPYDNFNDAAMDAEKNNKAAAEMFKGQILYAWARPVMLDIDVSPDPPRELA